MELSNRLRTLTKYVPKGSKVVDVGTDHAYIPIYLIRNQLAKACIATDINKGPLVKAQSNIKRYGISNIELRLTNGLQGIKPEEAEVVMISGMGGYLIIDILSQAKEVVKGVKKLILQPQQDIEQVRRFLHQQGFKIETEDFTKDDDKYYVVIVAVPGVESYTEAYEYDYGKCLIEKKLPFFKEWMVQKQEKLNEIYNHISDKQSEHILVRKKELEAEMKMHEEVMKCLF